MKNQKDYIRDIAEIRSMMERSSKFLSLSGWAGIMAGVYALTGAYIAYEFLGFHPDKIGYAHSQDIPFDDSKIMLLALSVLILALGTAIYLSYKRASQRGERLWNPTAQHLLVSIAVPLVAGGILILILFQEGLIGLAAPLSLLFYGLALFSASRYTYKEVQVLGFVQISLGLISCYFVEYGLLLWVLGFGLVHIVYGIHMNFKYGK